MNFSDIENKFQITVPTEFKLFYKLLESSRPVVEYFDTKENYPFRLTKWIKVMGSEILIDSFFDFTELNIYWARHLEMWGGSLQYLPFGLLANPHSGQLLLGILKEEYGRIYYSESGNKEPVFLSMDLYSFIESFKMEYRTDKIDDMRKLYKNWGENFWRIN